MRRLTFVQRGGAIELLSDRQVDMIAPPHRGAAGEQARFWYELRNANDAVKHRVVADDPIPRDTEVFTNDPSRPIVRAPIVPTEVVFTAVLPDDADVSDVRLMRAPDIASDAISQKAQSARTEPIEIARFKLEKRG